MDDSIRHVTGEDALRNVVLQAGAMAAVDNQAERGYAHLGWLMLEVSEMGYWRVRYNTFKDYLESVAKIARKTTGQLQTYLITVRDLSDIFTPAQLETMGITKAVLLRNKKFLALVFPSAVIQAALDSKVTVKELRKVLATTMQGLEDESGDWMDCEMEFMVTPEQRATIEQAIDLARRHPECPTNLVISKSAQMLDVMMKFAWEYIGGHAGEGQ